MIDTEFTNGIGLRGADEESHPHRLGVGIGAVLAAGTAGATGGVLVGPIGAIIGAVVGAVAGGLGGRAIAEIVDPATDIDVDSETYTARVHFHPPDVHSDEGDSEDIPHVPDVKQASRKSWSRADQTGKELRTDTFLPSDDS